VAELLTFYEKGETQLNRQRDYFAAIFDNVNDAIVIQDPLTGAILDVNATACRKFGYIKREFLSVVMED
jgi:PAS domain S-box-containing protein